MSTQTICIAPPLLHRCYCLLLSMHSHFNNSTYMYILPRLNGAPTHWLGTPLYIVSLLLFYCCSSITFRQTGVNRNVYHFHLRTQMLTAAPYRLHKKMGRDFRCANSTWFMNWYKTTTLDSTLRVLPFKLYKVLSKTRNVPFSGPCLSKIIVIWIFTN
jgi:hypothetical protein